MTSAGAACAGRSFILWTPNTPWRVLLKDGLFIVELNPEDFPDVAAIRARWAEERQAFWAYFSGLGDLDLAGPRSAMRRMA